MTVGSARDSDGVGVTLAERWNGGEWSVTQTPNPGATSASRLDAVDCRSVRSCMAVGAINRSGNHKAALVERWDGSGWSIQSTPKRLVSLSGVSCPSTTACMVVGGSQSARWNGRRWSVRSTGKGETLIGVSCWSSNGCVAVGTGTFAERWNGRNWSTEHVPDPGGINDTLWSVSCVSAGACLAIGTAVVDSDGDTRTFGEVWDGRRWSFHDAAYGGNSTGLLNVSCTSASYCRAVGSFTNSAGFERPLVERWNGHWWSVERVARPSGADSGQLAALSCRLRAACVTVGSSSSQGGMPRLMAQRRGSSWSLQTIPDVTASAPGVLNRISCPSPTECMAVGYYTTDANLQVSWAQRWNGSGWVMEETPNPAGVTLSSLDVVSCSSDGSCMALGTMCTSLSDCGSGSSTDTQRTFAERWDGHQWSIVAAPLPAKDGVIHVRDVSCASASSCLAVGDVQNASALAELWNGSTWTIVSPPALIKDATYFNGVSCTSASGCAAVGYVNSQAGQLTLAEVWSGTGWTTQTTPTPNSGSEPSGVLSSISCTSAAACTAVGSYDGMTKALVEVWNGSTWTVQTVPAFPGASVSNLNAVSCGSADACVAVGSRQRPSSEEPLQLAEVESGGGWTIETLPNPQAAESSQLDGVSCLMASACFAVGRFGPSSSNALSPASVSLPLVERRTTTG
jgi:hypothetical protein